LDAQVWRELSVMAVALALFGWVVMRNRVRHVPPHHVEIVERLGRYRRTAGPGRHVLTPFDSARVRLDLRERTHVTRREPAQTADGVWVSARFTIRYRIADPVKWTYESLDPLYALAQLAFTMLRNELGPTDLAQVRAERASIAARVGGEVGTQAPTWGIALIDLSLEDFEATVEGGA
jgi:regulator of protease activity HflC (stomatin/prohibitin superfamily)